MHTRWLLTALLATTLPALAARPPKVQWTKKYSGFSVTGGYCVVQTRDGGYVAAGITYPDTNDYRIELCYVVKADSHGNVEWQKTDEWAAESDGRSIAQTRDGGYIVTGTASGNSPDSTGTYLMKLSPTGEVLWHSIVDTRAVGFSVIQTADCGFVVSELIPAADSGVGLVRTDSLGNLQWKKRYSMPYGIWSDYIPMRQTADGGFIIGAKTLIKVDSAGVLQWMKTYNGVFAAYSVVQTPDGGYAATGFLEPDTNQAGDDMYLLKTDSVGNLEWKWTYCRDGLGNWVELAPGNGLVAIGAPYRYGPGFALRTDSVGNVTWKARLGGASAQHISRTSDGGYIVTGCARGQLMLAKLAPERTGKQSAKQRH